MEHEKRRYLVICVVFLTFIISICFCGNGYCELPGNIVTVSWLAENVSNPNLLVLDVRLSPQEYNFGHIPGAVCAFARWRQRVNGIPFMLPPLDYVTEKLRQFGVNNKSEVVVYSEGHTMGGIAWACRVAWTLDVLGHNSVAILDGGISEWVYEGRPLKTEAVKPPRGDFIPDLDVTKLATLDDVQFLGAKLVDFRVPARYFGIEKGRTTIKYGHIPGSLSLPAEWLTVTSIPKLLRPKDQLEKMALGAGIPADRSTKIIALCDTAHFASLGYWVLRYLLGYQNVRLYDASLVEYSRYSLPMELYKWPPREGAPSLLIYPGPAPAPQTEQLPIPPSQGGAVIEEDEGC